MLGKADYRRQLVSMQSAKLLCGSVYASAGEGESTSDVVFGGHQMIAENGALGCILVGLFAFLLGVCVTVLLYRLRGADERRRQDEPDDED